MPKGERARVTKGWIALYRRPVSPTLAQSPFLSTCLCLSASPLSLGYLDSVSASFSHASLSVICLCFSPSLSLSVFRILLNLSVAACLPVCLSLSVCLSLFPSLLANCLLPEINCCRTRERVDDRLLQRHFYLKRKVLAAVFTSRARKRISERHANSTETTKAAIPRLVFTV